VVDTGAVMATRVAPVCNGNQERQTELLDDQDGVVFTCLGCWQWVMQLAVDEAKWVQYGDLPSWRKLKLDYISSGRKVKKLRPPPGFLRIEGPGERVWVSGTAFDQMGDKDLLAQISNDDPALRDFVPASHLVAWDCDDVSEVSLPNPNGELLSVLKAPLGCQGVGIHFVTTPSQVLEIIAIDAENARNEPGFMEYIMSSMGRIPKWVVQAYIPSLLINDRKFHLRVYIVAHGEELWYYPHFECRIACSAYSDDHSDREAHITNGAGGSSTQRLMLEEVEALSHVAEKVEPFLTGFFSSPRVKLSLAVSASVGLEKNSQATKVLDLAALDLMVDAKNHLWLLEVNAKCPAAPEQGLGSEKFQGHLVAFASAVFQLARHHDDSRFVTLST